MLLRFILSVTSCCLAFEGLAFAQQPLCIPGTPFCARADGKGGVQVGGSAQGQANPSGASGKATGTADANASGHGAAQGNATVGAQGSGSGSGKGSGRGYGSSHRGYHSQPTFAKARNGGNYLRFGLHAGVSYELSLGPHASWRVFDARAFLDFGTKREVDRRGNFLDFGGQLGSGLVI